MGNIRENKAVRRIIRFIKSRFEYVSLEEKKYLKEIENNFPNVLTTTKTLDLIIKKHLSISRFGDAEFDICNKENENDVYQRPSEQLTERLKEILAVERTDFLVCIPPFRAPNNNIKNYYGSLSFWEWYWLKRYSKIKPLLKLKCYGNSFISRDSVFYENKMETIKKIWDKRDVVFVYGDGGRFKKDSIIFDNIKSSQTVLVPAQNAFDDYDRIYADCLKYPKTSLFLLAAGPTACVLAYDLTLQGFQALDVGHIPNCYDQYRGTIVSPEALPLNNRSGRDHGI